MTWCLYLIECAGGRLYAGITNRLEHRYAAHVAGRGAKFTRAFPPLRLVATRNYPDRSSASSAEYHVKKLARHKKIAFIEGNDLS